MAGKTNGRMPCDFQYWTAARVMVAILAMPRLPTPMATLRSGFEARGESGIVKLPLDFGGHIGDAAVGKMLANEEKAGELHGFMVAKVPQFPAGTMRRKYLERVQISLDRTPVSAYSEVEHVQVERVQKERTGCIS